GHGTYAGSLGDVLESPIPLVAEQPVAGRWGVGAGGKPAALDGIDVEEAVAVVVEQADPTAHGLGELMNGGAAVLEDEEEAGGCRLVDEVETLGRGCIRSGCRRGMPNLGTIRNQLGEGPG